MQRGGVLEGMRWMLLIGMVSVLFFSLGCDRREIVELESSRTGCPTDSLNPVKGCEERSYIVCNECEGQGSYYSCATFWPSWTGRKFSGSLILSECLRAVPRCAVDDFLRFKETAPQEKSESELFDDFLAEACRAGEE
jgi:hypothetical protein